MKKIINVVKENKIILKNKKIEVENIKNNKNLSEKTNKIKKNDFSEIENKDVIIIIGNIGSGKSTLINYLLGSKLIKKEIQENIIPVIELKQGENQFAKIRHNFEKSEIKGFSYYSNGNLNFLEADGFFDVKGNEDKINFFIMFEKIKKRVRSLKFIIIIDHRCFFTHRLESAEKKIYFLTELFSEKNDLEKYKNSFFLIINKQIIKNKIQRIKKFFSKTKTLQILKNRIFFYNPLNIKKEGILTKEEFLKEISKMNFINKKNYKIFRNAEDIKIYKNNKETISKINYNFFKLNSQKKTNSKNLVQKTDKKEVLKTSYKPKTIKIQKLLPKTSKFEKSKISQKKDRRKKIQDPTLWPFSPKGVLEITFGKHKFAGSGDLIFPMVVLTAAHNVYDRFNKEKATSIKFIPGANKNEAKFGVFKILDFFFPEKFKENTQEDYAILILDKNDKNINAGFLTGFYGVKKIDKIKEIENKVISLYGYPADKCGYLNNEMWGVEKIADENIKIEDDLIKYDIYTYCGQSGSGILLEDKGDYNIFGVHVRDEKGYNEGTLITTKRLKNIKRWILNGLLKFKDKFQKDIEEYLFDEEIDELDLNNCDFGDKGMKILSKFNLGCLKKLEINNNFISSEGIKYLFNNLEVKGIKYSSKLKLINLKELNLGKNNIGFKGMEFLSEMKLKNLQILNLKNNNIRDGIISLSKIKLDKLNELYLCKNFINKRIKSFSKMKLDNLKILDLCFNNIGDEEMKNISKMRLDSLEKLIINNNKISEKGIKYFSEMRLDYLKELNLSYNKIANEGIKYFSEMILDNLKELNLSFNQISDKGLKYFSFIKLDKLEILYLNNNQIGNEGMRYLSENHLSKLKKIELNNNKIGIKSMKYLNMKIDNYELLDLKKNNFLDKEIRFWSKIEFINFENLNLKNGHLDNEDVEYLSKFDFDNLKIINLENKNLIKEDLQFISEKKLNCLKNLNLKNNKIGVEGMKILFKMELDYLEILNLGENNLSDQGMEFFCKMDLRNLKKLILEKNQIKFPGIKSLLKMDLRNLEEFDLSFNKISVKAMFSFSNLNLKNLKELNLKGNGVRNKGLDYLSKNQKNFPKLEKLNLEETLINKKGLKFLLKMNLKKFKQLNYSNEFLKLDLEGKLIFLQLQKTFPNISITINSLHLKTIHLFNGVINSKYNKIDKGQGFMIFPKIIFTNAHNVYNREKDEITKNIKFSFICEDNLMTNKQYKVLEYFYPNEYKENSEEDYAILLLDKNSENFEENYGLTNFENNKNEFFTYINENLHLSFENKNSEVKLNTNRLKNKKEFNLEKYGYFSVNRKILLNKVMNCLNLENNHSYFNKNILMTKERLIKIKQFIIKGFFKYSKKFNEELKYFLKRETKNRVLNLININEGVGLIKYLLKIKLDNIEELYLSNNKIGEYGLKIFSKIKFDNLRKLNLENNNIGNEGLRYFSKINLKNLKHLNLRKNNIGNEGIKLLSKIKFENLTKLNLEDNNIRNKGIKYLIKMNLEILKHLYLNNNKIGNEGLKLLSKLELENLLINDQI